MLGPEAVIALLGLGSLTLGGCMPPVRSNFEDARLAPGLYDGDADTEDGQVDGAQSQQPMMSVSATTTTSDTPCEVIPPPANE